MCRTGLMSHSVTVAGRRLHLVHEVSQVSAASGNLFHARSSFEGMTTGMCLSSSSVISRLMAS